MPTDEQVIKALAYANNVRDSEGACKWKPIGHHLVALADEVERLQAKLAAYVEEEIAHYEEGR